ncbi:hypothetical protein BGZ83_003401 [Gryganskiella cystojenkinii]|nr:hypothetical protein BGZ83_003401 [Gryganskiella cystojenkinii]
MSSSFGPGSIFYDDPAPKTNKTNRTNDNLSPIVPDKKHSRPNSASSLSALASPPPSPSRNAIFDMPWSGSAGPNISSLRTSTTAAPTLSDTTTTAAPPTSSSSFSSLGYGSKIHLHSSKGARTSSEIADRSSTTSYTTDATAIRGSTDQSCRVKLPPTDTKRNYIKDPLTSSALLPNSAVEESSILALHHHSSTPSLLLSPVHIPPLSLSKSPSSGSKSQRRPISPLIQDREKATTSTTTGSAKTTRTNSSAFELLLDRNKKSGFLGHGRHAEVYKALLHPTSAPMRDYLLSRTTTTTQGKSCADLFQTNNSLTISNQTTTTAEQKFPCAAKCLNSDAESQAVGLAEAEILRRLHSHHETHPGRQHLVDYYGLYDQTTKVGIPSSEGPVHADQALRINENGGEDQEAMEGEWALILEYCQYGSIWDWIRQHPDRVGFRQWLTWAIQLLEALDYIHEAGLVHHDIKPHNILLDANLHAKVSDFGASLFLHEENGPVATNHFGLEEGIGRGTPPYSAPEMFASASGASGAQYGQNIDIYSLGVTLYVIGLTAQEPFHKIKSVLEMVVWIRKGGFWLWEDQGWVHDRGPVPKETPSSRQSMSSASKVLAHQASQSSLHAHVQSPGSRPEERGRARSNLSNSPSTASLAPLPNLPPINTQLPLEGSVNQNNSSCSTVSSPGNGIFLQAPFASSPRRDKPSALSFTPGYSPERLGRSSLPATPVSPLPLPSPIIRHQTPSSSRPMSRSNTGEMNEHRKSGEVIMRFLNGEIVSHEVIHLLKDMCHSDPTQRPNAKQTLQRLRDMEAALMMDLDEEDEQTKVEIHSHHSSDSF